ncbi:MAG TPA: preprotein translocase subunit SecE [Phycisphaerae bacterium]|nr:preprotein translocase subunit SecE [Phycisphaerae bacterium]
MTTLDYKKGEKRGFFTIYKPGQGKYVRWGTVTGSMLIVGLGLWWLSAKTPLSTYDNVAVKAGVLVAWAVVGALVTFYCVNAPKAAEFLIMTESEMRKVTWPTRRELIAATKVVIFLTFVLAVILGSVDLGFLTFFRWIGIS